MYKIKSLWILVLSLLMPLPAALAQTAPHAQQIEMLKQEISASEERVKAIVNQPVPKYPLNTWLQLSIYTPGWFHPGATKPLYDTIDVRRTQEFPYDKSEYSSSDVTPGVMFKSKDLEFNSMLKYYYVDRSLPKKRLTEAEMDEINRLYRIIGADQKKLADLEGSWLPYATFGEFLGSGLGLAAQLIVIAIAGLIAYRMLFKRR